MRTTPFPMIAILGLLLACCAGALTAPTLEARQALAPTGKLRVGLYLGGPASVIRDSASGEMKGVGYDLGKEFARRMGVPFEPVVYQSVGALVDNARSGQWDIAFLGILPERAKDMDFTTSYLEVEFGYLVPSGSPVSTLADVDRPGIRVAVMGKGIVDIFLSRELKSATVVRGPGLAGALELLKSGRADVLATSKPNLFAISGQVPGSRILEGYFATEQQAIALPKGRDLGLAYARKFVEGAKSEGLVKTAVERAGLRGVVEARPQ